MQVDAGFNLMKTRSSTSRWLAVAAVACAAFALSGCDQLGIETPQKSAERQTAEAKAIGSACRHATRAIEDCYLLNPKAEKSSVFAGWREMDEYMRENKLEGIAPVVPRPPLPAPAASKPSAPADADEEELETEAEPKSKPSGKAGGKPGAGKAGDH